MEGSQWWEWSHLIWAHLENKSQQQQYLALNYQLEESIDQIELECEEIELFWQEEPIDQVESECEEIELFWQIKVQEFPKEVVPARKLQRKPSL